MSENNIKINSARLKDISFGMRVLYVEDDPVIQQQLKIFLLRFFAHIDTANNGVEALKLYEKDKYDLIITDLSMPQMGGIELSIHVKEMDTDQYIIVVSAHSESDKLIDLLNIGVDGFILKPVHFTLVIKQLTKICQVISNRNELKYLNKILENTNKELQQSNIEYHNILYELMNLKKSFNQDTKENINLDFTKKEFTGMDANEYNYIYLAELSQSNENFEELEYSFNTLLLDSNYEFDFETILTIQKIFKIYAYELKRLPDFTLLTESMIKLEKAVRRLKDTKLLPVFIPMLVSLFSSLERWRLGILKDKNMQDIHSMDNDLIEEIFKIEDYIMN